MSDPSYGPHPGWSGPPEQGPGGQGRPTGPGGPGGPASPFGPGGPEGPQGPSSRMPLLFAVAAVLVLLVGGGVAVALLQGETDPEASCATLTAAGCDDPSTSSPQSPTDSTSTSTTESTSETTTETTSESGEYCTQLAALETQLTKFQSQSMDTADLDAAITALENLQAVAPQDIRPQISAFLHGFTSLRALLDDLDLTFAQFQDPTYLSSHASSWTAGQRQRITTVTDELTASAFTDAGGAIDADFRERC
jgi:hypothetical protein